MKSVNKEVIMVIELNYFINSFFEQFVCEKFECK